MLDRAGLKQGDYRHAGNAHGRRADQRAPQQDFAFVGFAQVVPQFVRARHGKRLSRSVHSCWNAVIGRGAGARQTLASDCCRLAPLPVCGRQVAPHASIACAEDQTVDDVANDTHPVLCLCESRECSWCYQVKIHEVNCQAEGCTDRTLMLPIRCAPQPKTRP
jgi:hypothetical protein